MTIYNLGSINADHIYNVPHLPRPGETLSASSFVTGLGGKGINQSVAAALAGAKVVHIGAVGLDGGWAVEQISDYGIDAQFIRKIDTPTGHAIVNVDQRGENAIVVFSGANNCQNIDQIQKALRDAKAGDILLLQNETTLQDRAAKIAFDRGMKVIYSAAPFSVEAIKSVMENTTILLMNKVESDQLCTELETELLDIPISDIIVTKGSDGADWLNTSTEKTTHVTSFPVSAIDTTAAGDTFAGYFAAGLDQGLNVKDAMVLGSAAAAIKVTRMGTADAIPVRSDVDMFLQKGGL